MKNPIIKSTTVCALALSVATLLTLTASIASGAGGIVIISDGFSGNNAQSTQGRIPDTTDLPGTTWSTASQAPGPGLPQSSINTVTGVPAPSADTGFNDSTFISIASTGGYTKPLQLNESISLRMNGVAADTAALRGIGLGFFSSAPANFAESGVGFTGLLVQPNGTLRLIVGGAPTAASVAPFAGFSTSTYYGLSFTVNTTTGSITSVLFNGNDNSATFSGAVSAGAFTPAVTNLAGYYASSAQFTTGSVDNFLVATPEPGSAALLGLGTLGLLARRRRSAQG